MLSLSYEIKFADRYQINVVQCRGAWLFYVIIITAHIAADRILAFSFWDRPEKQVEFRFGNVERLKPQDLPVRGPSLFYDQSATGLVVSEVRLCWAHFDWSSPGWPCLLLTQVGLFTRPRLGFYPSSPVKFFIILPTILSIQIFLNSPTNMQPWAYKPSQMQYEQQKQNQHDHQQV